MDNLTTPLTPLVHRRGAARLRTGLPARLIDVRTSLDVRLEDLSHSGARIATRSSVTLRPGETVVLEWAGVQQLGEIVWADGDHAGILFDEPVDNDTLLDTRHLQDRAQRVGMEQFFDRKDAQEWVCGRYS